ncbi:MAG TPA: hypothetical protein GX011_03330 [Clostridiales bacterium]|jgi:hypothetical protein|nr:hypothetical protein [Clostridiales bacterium]
MTGATVEVTDVTTIESIAGIIKKISGSSPISDKGYYGGYYYVRMFVDDCEYGIYEEDYGFKYACRYQMAGVNTRDVFDIFAPFFENYPYPSTATPETAEPKQNQVD